MTAADTIVNVRLIDRPVCPHCQGAAKVLVRTSVAGIAQWRKFQGTHYRLEELDLPSDTGLSVRWCAQCHFGFADPVLDQEGLSRLYNEVIVKKQTQAVYANSVGSRRPQVRLILDILDH